MVRIPTHRQPTSPGEMLLEEFCGRWGSPNASSPTLSMFSYQRIDEIVNGRRGVTPSTALRLAKFFEVSPDFWMNLQLRWDLYQAQQSESNELLMIQTVRLADARTHSRDQSQDGGASARSAFMGAGLVLSVWCLGTGLALRQADGCVGWQSPR